MKPSLNQIFVILFLPLSLVLPFEALAENLLINNATFIDVESGALTKNASLRIKNGRISEIADGELATNSDRNIDVIDAAGHYLIPGIAEMHGHIPTAKVIDQQLEDLLFLYLANGVTTVRGMLGAPGQLHLRDRVLDAEVLGPTLYLGGPSLNGRSVRSAGHAREKVRRQFNEGWDFLKIHPGLSMDEYQAMADEARGLGMSWAGHVPEAVGLEAALKAGQATIDHQDGYDIYLDAVDTEIDPTDLQKAIELTLASGTGVVPTARLWEILLRVPEPAELEAMDELKYVSPAQRSRFKQEYGRQPTGSKLARVTRNAENRRIILRALADGGVPILLGSDAPQLYSVPGFSIQREMHLMAEAGLPPLQILQSGTLNVGRFFAAKDKFGQIAVGHRADLILLRENPLEDINHMREIEAVVVRGGWISRERIDQRLKEIEQRMTR